MTKLYGVVHGFATVSLSGLHWPSPELLEDLASIPPTRIGIEALSRDDWKEIRMDLAIRGMQLPFERMPRYSSGINDYWESLAAQCTQMGHYVICLDKKEPFLRYNRATVEAIKAVRFARFHDGEPESSYLRRHYLFRENEQRKQIEARRIHEIERDKIILREIKQQEPKVAVVGLGHADYWMANQKQIFEQHGILFESYATESAQPGQRPIFRKNAVPDPRLVYERTSLERAIRLAQKGRITDETPDFVGTWEIGVNAPSTGYFEMIVQRSDNGKVTGTIEDCIGSAHFEGVLAQEMFCFTKVYTDSVADAAQGEIEYVAKRTGNEYHGHFSAMGMQVPFYMIAAPKAKPIDLALSWHRLAVKS